MRGTGSIQSIDVYDYERKTVLIPSTSELKQVFVRHHVNKNVRSGDVA